MSNPLYNTKLQYENDLENLNIQEKEINSNKQLESEMEQTRSIMDGLNLLMEQTKKSNKEIENFIYYDKINKYKGLNQGLIQEEQEIDNLYLNFEKYHIQQIDHSNSNSKTIKEMKNKALNTNYCCAIMKCLNNK